MCLTYYFNQQTEKLYKAQEQLRQLAYYDPLTGLANRRLFFDVLKKNIDNAESYNFFGAVLYIDLDRFKLLNDSLGHDIGDELLKQAAERIQNCVRQSDTVARFGGDEFIVILDNIRYMDGERTATVQRAAEKILNSIFQPFNLENHKHNISSSIGIGLYPADNVSPEVLLNQADAAMYWAKSEGGNRIVFFKQEMQDQVNNRLKIEKDLRSAIEDQQLFLVFQPQVTVEENCNSAESLLRWNHPVQGLIPPDVFIPIAEESDLIILIGEWVLREACSKLRSWNEQGIKLTKLAVNISPIQFQRDDFLDTVHQLVLEYEINPSQLMLEITEGVAINNIDETIIKMFKLKELGFEISLDDFGTGYSSLTYLRQIPISQLKIDRSFVMEMMLDDDSATIVQTIITMAEKLNINIIAEGVETQQEVECLIAYGCDNFQGYFYSKPLISEDFIKYILK